MPAVVNSRVEEQARATSAGAAVLGWSLPAVDVVVLGTKLTVYYQPDPEVLQERRALGIAPCTVPFELKRLLECQGGVWTKQPVSLRGAILARKTWTAAKDQISIFAAFGQQAVVLPKLVAGSDRVWLEAVTSGIGIVGIDHGDATVIHPPDVRSQIARTWIHRLVEEQVLAASQS